MPITPPSAFSVDRSRALCRQKIEATPVGKVKADLMLRALQEILSEPDAPPTKQLAVIQNLVKEIIVGVKDCSLEIIDPTSDAALSLAAGMESFEQRPEWLPERNPLYNHSRF